MAALLTRRLARTTLVLLCAAMPLAAGACSSDNGDVTIASKTTEAAATSEAPAPTDATETTEAAPTTKASTATPDPCELVTIDEATALLPGAIFQPGTINGPDDDRMCQYAADPSSPTAQVEVYVGPGAKKSLDIDKDTLSHEFTNPSGVGDEAFLEDGNIFFRKDTLWIQIRTVTLSVEPAVLQANLISLATAVVAKL